jgi:hypothetical protein
MSRQRDVLEQLKRDEPAVAEDRFEPPIEDRRVKGGLAEALAGSRKAGLAATLEVLPLDEICRALGQDDALLAPKNGGDGTATNIVQGPAA